jgi:hypothetical protein
MSLKRGISKWEKEEEGEGSTELPPPIAFGPESISKKKEHLKLNTHYTPLHM